MLIKTNSQGHARHVDGSKIGNREKLLVQTLIGFTKSHPCIGARLVSAKDGLFLSVLDDMRTVKSAFTMLQDLDDYLLESKDLEQTEKTCAIAFHAEPIENQDHFAQLYWEFLQLLHDIDCLSYDWDTKTSCNPLDHDFELSLRGVAFFSTTLNPRNPRYARKFPFPVWIMNQLTQFDYLRKIGRFSSWQQSIRKADSDIDPSGEPNPILADHGESSAASQLAGSAIKEIRFKARTTSEEKEKARQNVIERAISEGCPADIISAIEQLSLQSNL